MWMLANCKNGASSYEVSRATGITQKSTWFMLQRIRLALQDPNAPKLSGEVEADESYVGGKAEFMHFDRRTRMKMAGKLDRGGYGKAIVLGLLDRQTKQARVKVVQTSKKGELRNAISERVEQGSTLYTDALKSYRGLPVDGFAHEFIDHAEAYARGVVHTNGLENFWSLMKRALKLLPMEGCAEDIKLVYGALPRFPKEHCVQVTFNDPAQLRVVVFRLGLINLMKQHALLHRA